MWKSGFCSPKGEDNTFSRTPAQPAGVQRSWPIGVQQSGTSAQLLGFSSWGQACFVGSCCGHYSLDMTLEQERDSPCPSGCVGVVFLKTWRFGEQETPALEVSFQRENASHGPSLGQLGCLRPRLRHGHRQANKACCTLENTVRG